MVTINNEKEIFFVRKVGYIVSEIPICTSLFSSQWELEDVPVTQKPTCEELEQSVEEFERQAGGKK